MLTFLAEMMQLYEDLCPSLPPFLSPFLTDRVDLKSNPTNPRYLISWELEEIIGFNIDIGCLNFLLELYIGIGNWDWNLGLEIRIGNWDWKLRLEIGIENWD